jgi:hypothetical protein
MSPPTATNGMEPASIGGGFALLDYRSDKVFATQFFPPPSVKEYVNASFGPIIEGHYTEF